MEVRNTQRKTLDLNDDFFDLIRNKTTNKIYARPVLASCGHTIELDEINSQSICPMPNCKKYIATCFPNKNIQALIAKVLDQDRSLYTEQYFSGGYIKELVREKKGNTIIEIFKAHPHKMNERIVDGMTILHLAVDAVDDELVRQLIENFKTLNINAQIEQANYTVLYQLATKDPKQFQPKQLSTLVDYLLKQGADPSIVASTGVAPLAEACKRCTYEVIDVLIASNKLLNANASDAKSSISCALIEAAKHTNFDSDVFSKLLKLPDINPNKTDGDGNTCLMHLAMNQQDIANVIALLRLPHVNYRLKNIEEMSAYEMAIARGHVKVAAVLYCYTLFLDWLKDCDLKQNYPTIYFDCLHVLNETALLSLVDCLEVNGYNREVSNSLVQVFILIKSQQVNARSSTLFQYEVKKMEPSGCYDREREKLFHHLFDIALKSQKLNQDDWPRKIRYAAEKELISSLQFIHYNPGQQLIEGIDKLKKQKSEFIFKKHLGHSLFGRTGSQKRFDERIKDTKKELKKSYGID